MAFGHSSPFFSCFHIKLSWKREKQLNASVHAVKVAQNHNRKIGPIFWQADRQTDKPRKKAPNCYSWNVLLILFNAFPTGPLSIPENHFVLGGGKTRIQGSNSKEVTKKTLDRSTRLVQSISCHVICAWIWNGSYVRRSLLYITSHEAH